MEHSKFTLLLMQLPINSKSKKSTMFQSKFNGFFKAMLCLGFIFFGIVAKAQVKSQVAAPNVAAPNGNPPTTPNIIGPTSVSPGTTSSVYTTTAGTSGVSFAWSVSNSSAGTYAVSTSGTTSTLTFHWISTYSGTVYIYCTAANTYGSSPIGSKAVAVTGTTPLVPGTISPSNQSISYNAAAMLTGTIPTGGSNSYAYQWQSAASNNGTYTNINGATGQNYTTPPLAATTYFHRVDYSNGASANTNFVTVTVTAPTNNFTAVWIPSLAVTTTPILKSYENDNSSVNISTTYLDGLGLKIQTVAKNQTTNNSDLIQPYEHDNLKREVKKYLPYAYSSSTPGAFRSNANTSEQSAFYNSGSTTNPQSLHAFSQISLDNSPLDRTMEQGAPGDSWQLSGSGVANSGHTTKYDYLDNNTTAITNVNNTRLVVSYGVSIDNSGNRTLIINGSGYYQNSDLFVTTIDGENWVSADGKAGTVETYTNKEGQLILKRTFVNNISNSITILSTYFVYDDLGNLCYVLPAGAAPDVLTQSNTVAITTAALSNMCYQYNYDAKQRLIAKKKPSQDWEYIVYNSLNQQVAAQDGVQRGRNEWSVKKYDALGRTIITGIWNNNNTAITQAALQTILNGQTGLWESRTPAGNGYTNLAWPLSLNVYYSINFYDDYNVPGLPSGYAYQTYSGNANGYTNQTHGLSTVSETWALSNASIPLWTVQYYDIKGRKIQIQKTNQLSGKDIYNNEYSFTGQITKNVRQHSSSTVSLTVANRYVYDHLNRLYQHYEQIGSDPEVLLSQLTYNDLGQLINKKLHEKSGNSSFIQSIDYRYNIRGWLTSINDPSLTANSSTNPDNSSASDADKYGITYQYDLATLPQYNGNIGSTQWSSATPPGNPVAPLLKYDFRYDKINRLTESVSSTGTTKDGNFAEYASYDGMGNLQTIGRWAKLAVGKTQIDSLKYNYNGNQVNEIDDLTGNNTYGFTETVNGAIIQTANEYAFDLNGNLTQDLNKGITKITYNNFYLPASITWSNGNTLVYDYDGTGNKLTSTFTGGGSTTTTSYVSGIQYLLGQINFVQTDEGLAIKNQTTGSYVYNYALKDQLGSTMVVIQPAESSETTAIIVQISNYYAYGLEYASNDPTLLISYVNGQKDNFLYTGKEEQLGNNDYDYGARQYDPATGRWMVVDNLSEASEQIDRSPYAYAWNNPVLHNDPDGNCPLCAIVGAVIGGTVNMIAHWDPKQPWKNVEAFGIGAAVGAVAGLTLQPELFSGLVGGSALGAYTIAGVASGAASSLVQGAANSLAFGDKFSGWSVLEGAAIGGASGALGQIIGGYTLNEPSTGETVQTNINSAVNNYNANTSSLAAGDNLVYRALNANDMASLDAGTGIYGKNILGDWSLDEHLTFGSGSSSWANDPFISTTKDFNIAQAFNQTNGYGIIQIDLSKVANDSIHIGWEELFRNTSGYHFSIWQQEISIFGHIPQEAIKILPK